MAAIFLLAVGAHFLFVDAFASIVPGPLPFAREIVMLTGLVEGLLAIGLLIPSLRRLAGMGVAIYCVVVWPANLQMALDGTAFAGVTFQGISRRKRREQNARPFENRAVFPERMIPFYPEPP
ncbi:MAG: hypothetical protein AAF580_02330 [Pseudomonadota bacterium]